MTQNSMKTKLETMKPLQDMNLMDDFLMTESMNYAPTAQPLARLIIQRSTGLKVDNLVIECQKTVNGIDPEHHGMRLDISVNEICIKDESSGRAKVFDIEPNNYEDPNLPRRNRYYQSLADVKLLETGTNYDKLPDLWTIWILPYDPFGKNYMLYSAKNVVEGFSDIVYNDGAKTLYLYTDGMLGGNQELKALLQYLKHSRNENAVDSELAALHSEVEQLKQKREVGVKYMHVKENYEFNLRAIGKKYLEENKDALKEEYFEENKDALKEEYLEENKDALKEEAINMLKDELRDNVKEEIKSEVRDEYLLMQIQKKFSKNMTIEQIADAIEESVETVERLIRTHCR